MNRPTALLFFVLFAAAADQSTAQPKVDIKGIASKVVIDEVIFGHLQALNGKFKMRVSEVTFAPDGFIGVHHHVGPGVRYVASGELTFR